MDRITTAIKKFIILCIWVIIAFIVVIYVGQKPDSAADFIKQGIDLIGDFIGGLFSIAQALSGR